MSTLSRDGERATTTYSRRYLEDSELSYQLCEMCVSYGQAHYTPESVCECTPIIRKVSGPGNVDNFITVFELAEAAILNKWAPHWNNAIELKSLLIQGRASLQYTVTVRFEGTVNRNITNNYADDHGEVEVIGFSGEGGLTVGVMLATDV